MFVSVVDLIKCLPWPSFA